MLSNTYQPKFSGSHFLMTYNSYDEANKKTFHTTEFVDSNHDDEFFYFFTLRVTSIIDVYLKDTLITDKAVEYMMAFKNIKSLFIRRHENVTKASILFINEMKFLENLNVSKTQITLTDLAENLNNQNLKEVGLDGEEDEENRAKNLSILKERMPNCEIILS